MTTHAMKRPTGRLDAPTTIAPRPRARLAAGIALTTGGSALAAMVASHALFGPTPSACGDACGAALASPASIVFGVHALAWAGALHVALFVTTWLRALLSDRSTVLRPSIHSAQIALMVILLLGSASYLVLAPRGRALDLGAAPGGWTRVLAERGLAVTAVDPAALDRAVLALPGVEHQRVTAERFLTLGPPTMYDLIVNDMRLDARDAARLLGDYASRLSPRGHLLTTLKLPEHGYLPVLDQALDLFARRYRRVAARQLFHNRSEVTALFRPA